MDIGGGLVVAIVVICIGLIKIFRGPVGEAVADRLRGESGGGGGGAGRIQGWWPSWRA